ncbi:hypothetical protein BDZ97DRAFT_1663982 [Flammula alnicola]|nr:hypothetical protein BDZ97DRAFT_1673794 [Flammula alnicola]KAF8961680.1 hypothetical protein BDZ97DRAFT_1663982 [Flammula alnicola]
MHLIWENLVKNLVLHWTGEFKGLDEGTESYQLEDKVWEAIGEATAKSGSTIPSSYGSRIPNISTDKSNVSAEMWSFWTLYLGPVLLRHRFKHVKYFKHFVSLVRLLNICLQFEISDEEIEEVRVGFIRWVKDYETIYYQHNPGRLSACPLTIHALLHIADHIKAVGPVWCYWAFPMERYCGRLQPALRSRRFPYATLDRYVVDDAQLTQIKVVHNVAEELSLRAHRGTVAGTYAHPAYPDILLLPSSKPVTSLPSAISTGICASLSTRSGLHMGRVRELLRQSTLQEWGKVRRVDSEEGDTMHASSLASSLDDTRDATFVRYAMYVDIHEKSTRKAPELRLETFYGQLQHIFVVKFSDPKIGKMLDLDEPRHDVAILAAIRTCKLEPADPNLKDLDFHFYKDTGALHFVDITSVQCLVGRVVDGKDSWGIIDRSGSLVRAICEDVDI